MTDLCHVGPFGLQNTTVNASANYCRVWLSQGQLIFSCSCALSWRMWDEKKTSVQAKVKKHGNVRKFLSEWDISDGPSFCVRSKSHKRYQSKDFTLLQSISKAQNYLLGRPFLLHSRLVASLSKGGQQKEPPIEINRDHCTAPSWVSLWFTGIVT